jgi:colanic acid biosynthesis glycosyl transferase WcaI
MNARPLVTLVNQYYLPDVASSGQHLADLVDELVRQGHPVEILTSRSAYEGGRLRAPTREVRGSVTIRRLPSWGPRSRRTRFRLLDALIWHFFVLVWLTFHARPIVVTLTSPPCLTVWGTWHAWLHGSRHVAWTMDLHPDVEFALGVLSRRSPVGRALAHLDRFSLRRAHRVIALGPTQKRLLVSKGVRPERVVVVPIWPSGPSLSPAAEARSSERPLEVLYSGNAGLTHRFDEVLEAARRLQEKERPVRFTFAGGGALRPDLERLVAEERLHNVHFAGYMPLEAVPRRFSEADVHLVTLRPEMSGIAVPSKLQTALALGRPVIFVGGADAEAAIWLREGGGLVFGPGEGAALAAALEALASDAARRGALGREARALYERRFRKAPACLRMVEAVTGRPSAPERSPERQRGFQEVSF